MLAGLLVDPGIWPLGARMTGASVCQHRDLPTPVVVVDALDEGYHGTEFLTVLLLVIHTNQLMPRSFLPQA